LVLHSGLPMTRHALRVHNALPVRVQLQVLHPSKYPPGQCLQSNGGHGSKAHPLAGLRPTELPSGHNWASWVQTNGGGQGSNSHFSSALRLTKLPSGHCLTSSVHATWSQTSFPQPMAQPRSSTSDVPTYSHPDGGAEQRNNGQTISQLSGPQPVAQPRSSISGAP
jgi:hypothetical protein